MRHSRTEVRRWRMLRQLQRQKSCWMTNQSRRNRRILKILKSVDNRRRVMVLTAWYR